MKSGDLYIYNDGVMYSKVRIKQVWEQEEMNLSNDLYETNYFVNFEVIGSYNKRQTLNEDFHTFIKNARELSRTPTCWKCNEKLNERKNDICQICGWIKCDSDNACGCGYRTL